MSDYRSGGKIHGKRTGKMALKGSRAANAAIAKSKRVLKPDKDMKPPEKAKR